MNKNYKNVITVLLIIGILTCTLLIGCGGASNNDITEKTTEASQESSTVEVSESQESNTVKATESQNHRDDIQSTENEKNTTVAVTTSPVQKATEKATEKKITDKTSNEKKETVPTSKPTQAVTETPEPTEAPKIKTCTITVDDFCSSKTIEIVEGETVYDILKKTGASVSARNTGYGVYIEGINGRFEFDEGPTSGWVYTVNGSRPSTSCNKYEVKSGDKIVWTYVEEM